MKTPLLHQCLIIYSLTNIAFYDLFATFVYKEKLITDVDNTNGSFKAVEAEKVSNEIS